MVESFEKVVTCDPCKTVVKKLIDLPITNRSKSEKKKIITKNNYQELLTMVMDFLLSKTFVMF